MMLGIFEHIFGNLHKFMRIDRNKKEHIILNLALHFPLNLEYKIKIIFYYLLKKIKRNLNQNKINYF